MIQALAASLPYKLLILFFGLYPMVSALMWIGTSLIFFFRRERRSVSDEDFYDVPDGRLPFVSAQARPDRAGPRDDRVGRHDARPGQRARGRRPTRSCC